MRRFAVGLVLICLFLTTPTLSISAPLDQQGRCRFFAETSYSVCDDAQAAFLTALNGWGLQQVGYPISRRYERDGFVTQAFQKAIMQWRPESRSVSLTNIFDDLHRMGLDQRLLETRQTPPQLPDGWDGEGRSWEQIVAGRQALLNGRPALRRSYFAAEDPFTFFGLPTSAITDMGNHFAIRLQRAVLQEWKEDVPWAQAGQVTIANGGDLAKELGALPATALVPELAQAAPPPAPAPTPVPPPPAARTGALIIEWIRYDGVVYRTESDEYVVIANVGDGPVNVRGWRLWAGDPYQNFYFPDFVMAPGQRCRVYTNEFHPESCGFSFGIGRAIWNNRGDCGVLYDAGGAEVDVYCY